MPPFSFFTRRLSNPTLLECLPTDEASKVKAQKYFIHTKEIN